MPRESKRTATDLAEEFFTEDSFNDRARDLVESILEDSPEGGGPSTADYETAVKQLEAARKQIEATKNKRILEETDKYDRQRELIARAKRAGAIPPVFTNFAQYANDTTVPLGANNEMLIKPGEQCRWVRVEKDKSLPNNRLAEMRRAGFVPVRDPSTVSEDYPDGKLVVTQHGLLMKATNEAYAEWKAQAEFERTMRTKSEAREKIKAVENLADFEYAGQRYKSGLRKIKKTESMTDDEIADLVGV